MVLEVHDLRAGYGGLQVLHGVTLMVPPGSVAAVIGANGAGKTTLLRAISGILRPVSGRVMLDGRAVTGWPPERIVECGIVHVPERRQLFGSMRVEDNLVLGAYLRLRREPWRAIQADLERVYTLFPRLRERRRQAAATLSGGEQQMVAIGRALMARPRLLLLDEPSLGLAPLLVREFFRVVGELRAQGHTILLVEQNARQALRVADVAYVMETGRITVHGPGRELLDIPQVRAAYLGATVGQGGPADTVPDRTKTPHEVTRPGPRLEETAGGRSEQV